MSGTTVKYYVILPDGQRFGPADITLLNQWAAEGRILPTSMLEQEGTQMRLPASSVPGLVLTASPPYTPPTTFNQPPGMNYPAGQADPHSYAGYYRGPHPGGDMGNSDLTVAWVCSSVGLAMCFVGGCCSYASLLGIAGPIVGLIFSGRAQQKGHPSAAAAKIFSGVILGVQIMAVIAMLAFYGFAFRGFR